MKADQVPGDTWGGAIFGPRGIKTYEGSRPCGFRQEHFIMFLPIQACVNRVTLGRGHFWPQGHYLKKLGRGPLGGATYEIQKL